MHFTNVLLNCFCRSFVVVRDTDGTGQTRTARERPAQDRTGQAQVRGIFYIAALPPGARQCTARTVGRFASASPLMARRAAAALYSACYNCASKEKTYYEKHKQIVWASPGPWCVRPSTRVQELHTRARGQGQNSADSQTNTQTNKQKGNKTDKCILFLHVTNHKVSAALLCRP